MSEEPWYENVVMPGLLRSARQTYGGAMRRALATRGMDDIPANGMFVIGALALAGQDLPLGWFVQRMEISKQAAGQLIDTLVLRGYVERRTDDDDRRKLTVSITDRGRTAAQAQSAERDRIDAELLAVVGPDDLLRTRRTLAALADIGRQQDEGGQGDG